MIKYVGVGKIPIRNYLVIMDRRCYSPELAIEYTKDIYGIDISEEVKICLTMWDYSKNVYKEYVKENPPKSVDDKTREYFQKEGRRRYTKFYKAYKESEGYDLVIDLFFKPDVIHHIFPLAYGGSNDIMNLIPVIDLNHKLLHQNSVESKRECCFMAVDYLSYLYQADKLLELDARYNISQYKETTGSFMRNFLNSILEAEMELFYGWLKSKYDSSLKEDEHAS